MALPMPPSSPLHNHAVKVGHDAILTLKSINIGNLIGAGKSKEFFEGSLHGRRVAILKMKHRSIFSELAILKKLDPHPNILRLLGCVMDGTIDPLLVTEFATLGTLDQFIEPEMGKGYGMSPLHEVVIMQQVRQASNLS